MLLLGVSDRKDLIDLLSRPLSDQDLLALSRNRSPELPENPDESEDLSDSQLARLSQPRTGRLRPDLSLSPYPK